MFRASKFLSRIAHPSCYKKHFCTAVPTLETSLYEKFKGFRNTALEKLDIPGVTIVNTPEKAQKALKVLLSLDDR